MFVLSVTVGLYSQFDGNIDPRNFAAEACRGVYITDSDHAECSFIESRERETLLRTACHVTTTSSRSSTSAVANRLSVSRLRGSK